MDEQTERMCPLKAHAPLLVHALDIQEPSVPCQKKAMHAGGEPTGPVRKVGEISPFHLLFFSNAHLVCILNLLSLPIFISKEKSRVQ